MATFPGKPPNPLGFKAELNLAGTWTDITNFVLYRDGVTISGMGRADESGSITPSQLALTLKNDGRFTPKNASSPYFPNIVRNCQIRISVNATSSTGVNYSQFRFFGEVSSWPPSYDVSQRSVYVQLIASGIWRRISAAQAHIGSAYWRYVRLLTGTSVPAAYWAMEDGQNSASFVLSEGAGTNIGFTGTPSFAANSTGFGGSDALPQVNGARLGATVSAGPTPTSNVTRFALLVPPGGDGGAGASSWALVAVSSSGTVATLTCFLNPAGTLTIQGQNSGGTIQFNSTTTTKVQGVPYLVSMELTAAGGTITWALNIIAPGAGSVTETKTGTLTGTIAAVTSVTVNRAGALTDTALGQLGIFYAVPAIVTAAAAIGGYAGEFAVDRFNRLCAESNIPSTVIGSASAAMGPQADDTIANVLQSIEDTDGGLLYETRDQFGLGYRTLGSLQNQSAAVTVSHTAGVLGAPLTPTYDDQLIKNQWTVTNWDGYAALAQLTSGAISTLPPPNGVGSGYSASKTINANTHAQVNAIAQQLLFEGTTDDVRYPVITFNFLRAQAAPFFASIPGLRLGDYLSVTNLPAFLGGGTAKQLIWGYTERMTGVSWTVDYNTIPELPFETTFSPGVFSVTQFPSGAVTSGSPSVSGAQLGAGSVPAGALSSAISARTIGGMTGFIAAATPFDWSFAVSGTPADKTYFICTEVQALPIAVGDTFTNSGGLGGPFTVTSVDPPSGGNVTVHFSPDATSVMSTGTVFGGKNGDTWVNTSGGNQVNQWVNGAWVPITWNAASVLTASSITAGLIAAGTIIAGVVDGTTIMGATVIADGTSGEILVYSGTPATGNLIGSWSGAAGTDAHSNAFPAGLAVEIGGIVLVDQSSDPAAVTNASTFFSSAAGRPIFLSKTGDRSILDRSVVNVTTFNVPNTITPTTISASTTYQAGEGQQSSEYEMEIWGAGSWGTSFLNGTVWQLYVDGTTFGNSWTTGITGQVTGQGFGFCVVFGLSIQTTGSGGTALQWSKGNLWRNDPANTDLPSNSINGGSIFSGVAFNTLVSHTLLIKANWTNTAGGQTFTTYRTRITRRE